MEKESENKKLQKESLFKKKNIEKLNSPDVLDQFTKAAHPSLWIFLIAILLIVSGFAFMSLVGEVQITVPAAAEVIDKAATIYLKKQDAERVEVGQDIFVNDVVTKVKTKSSLSYQLTEEDYNDHNYLIEIGDFHIGDWISFLTADIDLTDGSYKADIVVENVKLIKYIFN